MAPPISKPKDFEMILKAPPAPIRTLVVIEDKLKAVVNVMATEMNNIPKAPTIPAFPTTHGCRMNMITPSIVKVVGVNTPANVPKVFLLM